MLEHHEAALRARRDCDGYSPTRRRRRLIYVQFAAVAYVIENACVTLTNSSLYPVRAARVQSRRHHHHHHRRLRHHHECRLQGVLDWNDWSTAVVVIGVPPPPLIPLHSSPLARP